MKAPILLAIFSSITPIVSGQDYQGAAAVLKQLTESAGAKPVEKKADPLEELRTKITELHKEAAALPPADAAKRWVALMDAYLTIPLEQLYSARSYADRLELNTVVAALPPASAWNEIDRLIAARKTSTPLQDEALRLLMAVLRGDEAARQKAYENLRENLTSQKNMEDYKRENLQQYIDQIASAIESLTGSDSAKIDTFEKQLALLEKGDERARQQFGGNLEVPDLMRFSNEKKATDLLIRLFKLGPADISVEGKATRRLAAALFLKHIDSSKHPLWYLVKSLEDAPLYEAMLKKHPKGNDWQRENATEIYLLALIANDRGADAVKLVEAQAAKNEERGIRLDLNALDEMGKQGLGGKVLDFLHQLLAGNPGLPYWESFIELSARQGASTKALKLLQDSLAKPDQSPKTRAAMQSHLYLALLAADQRAEGLAVLRELVKNGPLGLTSDGEASAQETRKRWEQVGVHVTPDMLKRFQQEASQRGGNGEIEHIRLCEKLASLGELLEQKDLVEEALTAATQLVEKMPATDHNSREQCAHSLVELLLKNQRGAKAEEVLAAHLAMLVAPSDNRRGSPRLDESLALLMRIYDKAGRYADSLAVLEQCPYWAAPDLAAFEAANAGRTPLLLLAARALAETGRKDDARRIIRRAAQDYPSKDPVYELLLKVGSDQPLEALLDELAKRDRFEERPLIWKARVLLNAGKVDDAEKAIRTAISIDPSDGEQGKGDRMRAYAIFAEVLEKKGDAATAKIMRGAVSAIRKSEAADDWWNAGLLSEAVRRYEAALTDFADAYCIQSRLALRYSELGQMDKAEQHYTRAFELMPDSFGRVESHCFGCEGAFNGQQAQNAAEKVFTRLASVPPVKAQVHYLLGYLRSAQNRSLEAAESYRLAVKADPDYLNAWERLAALAEDVQMPREESENAALQIFRLDPAGRHGSPKLSELRDLGRLWTTLLEAEAALPPTETGPLLPLTAAKTRLESAQEPDRAMMMWGGPLYPSLFSRRSETRRHLLENPLVQAATRFLEMLRQN